MIQEVVRKLIEDKLNDNTKSKKFIVGQYFYDEDKSKHFLYSVKTGYTIIEKNYIPCMITFSGDYTAIPNQINGYADIDAEFLIAAEDKEILNEDLSTLDELKPKIIGNYEIFADDSVDFESVWNMGTLLPIGVTLINGEYYTRIKTVISVDFSDTNTYGNAYKYTLNGNYIVPYKGSNDRQNDENYPHRLNDLEAFGGNDESRWTCTMQLYADTYVKGILESIASGTYDMAEVFLFSQRNYEGDVINEFPVQITSLSQPIFLGERQYITLSLIKSDVSS